MNKKTVFISFLALTAFVGTQGKKMLDHSTFDDWKNVRVSSLSNNGKWALYEVNPQQGDGVLTFRNISSGKNINIPRGYKGRFSADGKWGVALIKPFFKDTREAKIKKKKNWEMPQDTLAIVNLTTGAVEKVPNVVSYKLGKNGGDWIAFKSVDTVHIKQKALKDENAGRPLIVRNLPSGVSKVINWVRDYTFSEDGNNLATTIRHHSSDSTASDGMGVMMLPDTSFTLLDRDKKFYGFPVFSKDGKQIAWTSSMDSLDSGTKRAHLYHYTLTDRLSDPEELLVPSTIRRQVNYQRPHSNDPEKQKALMEQWAKKTRESAGDSVFLNQYSEPVFSDNGRRLIVGVAPAVAPNDTTIVDFEQAQLDIWRWDAPMTPPQENKNIDKLRKRTLPVAIDLATAKAELLSDDMLATLAPADNWNAEWALLRDPSKYIVSQQWDYSAPEDLYIVNLNTGQKRFVVTAEIDNSAISPAGKYVYWFKDRNYHVYDIATGETRILSANMEFPLWDEDQDIPMVRQPYGVMAWTDGDDALLVYDRYDVWSLDPKGVKKPENLTAGNGRKNHLRYRYEKTDPEERFLKPGQKLLFRVFDYDDKRNGYATMTLGKPAAPTLKNLEEYSFHQMHKAKDADVYAYQKANFNTSPDVYIVRNDNFAKGQKVTDANPQMKEYSWGSAQLVKWYAYNGDLTEGVLYTPEDLDPEKKYPMLVVFYERNSEELYEHYTMEPSWSWVNYPFYVSRGYVVFVPDVKYTPGVPGESAYNYICSGVEDILKNHPYVDKDRIGIDGQSWGGYQTAYLVTRTDMFACAGSGAPVSNMTSAFGGIRWGTGDSRQAQYEKGQSRIGRNLWEAPQLYIANSPLFYADRVQTPLLIMHNDDDGAVPWYQGIEMFMALRRLNKPVWMLQYNGEAHNIKARKNRKDITIRLQQFFDHYLKGDPMPRWMKEGIPAVRKGQDLATDLVTD